MRGEILPWFFSVISVSSVVKKACHRMQERDVLGERKPLARSAMHEQGTQSAWYRMNQEEFP